MASPTSSAQLPGTPTGAPASSWSVFLGAVISLHKAEYRVGDFSQRVAEKAKGAVARLKEDQKGEREGSEDDEEEQKGEKSENLGMVAIELQVGHIKKRTQPFKVSGEVRVEVNEKVLMPAPQGRSGMIVRVFRVGHLQKDALVGEATVVEALGQSGKVELFREKRKKCKGLVELTVLEEAVDFTPVLDLPDEEDGTSSMSTQLRELRTKIKEKIGGGKSAPARGGVREPLLASFHKSPSPDAIGKCVVVIQSIRGLQTKLQRPGLMVCAGEECRHIDNLKNRSQLELTFEFYLTDLHGNVCIYCFDELAANASSPVGRILLPLADAVWLSGKAPSVKDVGRLAYAPSSFQREYTAQFMPVGEASEGEPKQWNHAYMDGQFWPALRKAGGSGMKKSLVFGSVTLRLDVIFYKRVAPVLRCQVASFLSNANQLKKAKGQQKQEIGTDLVADSSEAEPTLMSVLRNVDLKMIVRNISRLEAAAQRGRNGGIIRWLRAAWWHKYVATCFWFLACWLGIIPPRPWAWPIFIWVMLLVNGLLSAHQRELQWADVRHPAFLVWNEDTEPEPATMKEKLAMFKRGTHEMMNASNVFVTFMERVHNMFTFVDAPVTVVCVLGSGIVAATFSLVWFLLELVDSTGGYTWGCIGALLFFYIARTKKPDPDAIPRVSQAPSVQPSRLDRMFKPLLTLMSPMVKFNELFRFVPDQLEVAHRYIATRIQCKQEEASKARLRVHIQSAKGLRIADWRPLGYGSSDPYCTCEILGKPGTTIKTPVIKRTLVPVWNYSAELAPYSVGDSVEFRVWDFDLGKRDDLLGRVTLKSRHFHPHGFEGDLELLEAGKGITATLNVKVEVLEANSQEPVQDSRATQRASQNSAGMVPQDTRATERDSQNSEGILHRQDSLASNYEDISTFLSDVPGREDVGELLAHGPSGRELVDETQPAEP